MYAHNKGVDRRPLWSDLECKGRGLCDFSWVVLGNFNAIRELKDRSGSANSCPSNYDEFRQIIKKACLEDLRYRGLFYTWQMTTIRHEIDRVLVNDS